MNRIEEISQSLLNYQPFIQSLKSNISNSKIPTTTIQTSSLYIIIQEIADLICGIIKHKMEDQLIELIQDNNRILEEIKKITHSQLPKQDELNSFGDIYKIVKQETKKTLFDFQLQKSILSHSQTNQNIHDPINLLSKRLKIIEDKIEVNFKSVWNVISMTESAVFQHMKSKSDVLNEKNLNRPQPQPFKKSTSILGFKIW